jgi:hypothetical protein
MRLLGLTFKKAGSNCSPLKMFTGWTRRTGGGAGGTGGDGGEQVDIDPIIRGLLARLPKSGDVWPEAERKLWLELLAGSFKLIYEDAPPTDSQHEAER